MNRPLSIACLAFAALAAPGRLPAGEPSAPAGPDRIPALIRQLGADAWTDRNAAAIALERIGPPAFEALHRAVSESDDPEIRHQASLILGRSVWKGVPFDLEEAFRGFFRKPAREKDGALRALEEKKESLGARRLAEYFERAFLYDPSPDIRALSLRLMHRSGVLPSRAPLACLAAARTDPASRRLIGLWYSRTGFPAEALAVLGPPPADPGQDPELARELSRSLAALGRVPEAAALVLRLPAGGQEGEEPVPDPWPSIAILVAARRPDEARARFLEAYPELGREVRFGARLSASGFPDAALKALDDCASLDADLLALRILARAGRSAEAARRLEKAASGADPGAPAVAAAARALAYRGMGAEALEVLGRLGRETPPSVQNFPAFLVERARILLALGRAPEAKALLLSEGAPKALVTASPELVRAAAFVLEESGAAAEALELLGSVRSLTPGAPGPSLAAAEILERMGRARDAQEALLAALPHVPDDAERARVASAVLRFAPATGGLEDLAKRIEAKAGDLEAEWRKRFEQGREPRGGTMADPRRVPLLGLLARIQAERGKAHEARALGNLAFLLAPASAWDSVLLDRVRVEGRIGSPESAAFLALPLLASPGEPDEAEARRRIEEIPVGFWRPLVSRGSGASHVVARQWAFREHMVQVASGGEPLPDPLRLEALEALCAVPGGAGAALLARLAGKSEESLRRAALARLEAMPPSEAVPALIELLRKTIGRFPWQQRVAAALARMPPGEARQDLAALAAPGTGRMAVLAARVLARQGDPEMWAVLEGMLRNPGESPETRACAALALSVPPLPERRALYAPLVDDPEPSVRLAAGIGMALLGDPEGFRVIAREVAFGSSRVQEPALEAAMTVGGREVRAVLAELFGDPEAPRDPFVSALEAAGPPEETVWRGVLDGLLEPDLSEDLRLGTFLDALADGADPAACREGLACWMEVLPPGAESGPSLARAARLALHAGETAAAERFYRRARILLEGAETREAPAALLRMLADFRREPEMAARAAEAVRRRAGNALSAAELEARALAAAGKTPEAIAVLDRALGDAPGPGRPWLVSLRSRLGGK